MGFVSGSNFHVQLKNNGVIISLILCLGGNFSLAQIQPALLKNKILESFVIYEVRDKAFKRGSETLYQISLAKVIVGKDTVWINRQNEIFEPGDFYLSKLDLTPHFEAVMPDDPKQIKRDKEREEGKRREQAFIDSVFAKNNIHDDFEMIGKAYGDLPYFWGRKNGKAGIIDLQGNAVIPFEYDQTRIYYNNEKQDFKIFTLSFEKETKTLTLAWWNSGFEKVIEYSRSADIFSPYGGITLALTDDGSLCRIILKNGKNKIANIRTLQYINQFEYDAIGERFVNGYLEVERKGKKLKLDEFGNEYENFEL